MADDAAPPPGVDVTKPSIARVYDASLGGKDNFEVDRATVARIMQVLPEVRETAYANRKALIRGVRYLAAEAGIRQFLDLGSGLPTMENTHQVAQRSDPTARVAYIDNDPIVLSHARALLDENDRTVVITADLRDVDGVLGHPEVGRLIDFTEPLAVLLVGMLHHFPDDKDPETIAAAYVDAMPLGSHLFVTHFCRAAPEADALEQAYLKHLGTGWFRTTEQIQRFFPGLEMVEPGLVPLPRWRPDAPLGRDLTLVETLIVGGIGRKN